MSTPSTINGNSGRFIGRRKESKGISETIKLSGVIGLYHCGELIVSEVFGSRWHRKEIINKWKAIYQLDKKHGVHFQVKYL
jgi:hypothetical protein